MLSNILLTILGVYLVCWAPVTALYGCAVVARYRRATYEKWALQYKKENTKC